MQQLSRRCVNLNSKKVTVSFSFALLEEEEVGCECSCRQRTKTPLARRPRWEEVWPLAVVEPVPGVGDFPINKCDTWSSPSLGTEKFLIGGLRTKHDYRYYSDPVERREQFAELE